MTSEEFKILLAKHLRGECTPEEEETVLKFYNSLGKEQQEGLDEERRLLMEDKLLAKLRSKIQTTQHTKTGARRYLFTTRRIAASILILLAAGASFYFFNYGFLSTDLPYFTNGSGAGQRTANMIEVGNSTDEPRQLTLPDGSQIQLSPNSTIHYPEIFAPDKREVHLTGEAFFDVAKDPQHPFLVYTAKVVTKVLGTSFKIKAFHEEKEITVEVRTGKVSVYTQNNKTDPSDSGKEEVILTPNQMAIYNKDEEHVSRQLVEDPQVILPESTLFKMEYDGASAATLFEVLEENYGVTIVYDEQILSNCMLTTSLAEEGLYERIKIICEAIGARYAIEGTNIIIHSDGCN
jgi:transmembrane sensor